MRQSSNTLVEYELEEEEDEPSMFHTDVAVGRPTSMHRIVNGTEICTSVTISESHSDGGSIWVVCS